MMIPKISGETREWTYHSTLVISACSASRQSQGIEGYSVKDSDWNET